MNISTILERHYQRGMDACQHLFPLDSADHAGLVRAVDCAALHVGIDAMARVTRKRAPQAGCVASYPPIAADRQASTTSCCTALHGHWMGLLRTLRQAQWDGAPPDRGLGRAIAVAGHYAMHC